jgi:hypothetical protein
MAEHFCLLAAPRAGASSGQTAGLARLLAACDMLQILSLYAEADRPLTQEVRQKAAEASAFVAERNRLLLETYAGLCDAAVRAGIRLEAMRGAGALLFYPHAGLRYMKDLDIGLAGEVDPAPLLEALRLEGWSHYPTPPGEPPMLTKEVRYGGPGAEAAGALFPDALRFKEGGPLTALYVEFNRSVDDEATRRAPAEASAAAAFRLACEEFAASEVNLKHLCDTVLALDWMSAPCCARGADEGDAARRVRSLLRPLGLVADAEGTRFRRDLADDSDVNHRRLVDFAARTAFGAGLTPEG